MWLSQKGTWKRGKGGMMHACLRGTTCDVPVLYRMQQCL